MFGNITLSGKAISKTRSQQKLRMTNFPKITPALDVEKDQTEHFNIPGPCKFPVFCAVINLPKSQTSRTKEKKTSSKSGMICTSFPGLCKAISLPKSDRGKEKKSSLQRPKSHAWPTQVSQV